MKIRLLLATCVWVSITGLGPLAAQAQGTSFEVLFSNKVHGALDAPVYDVDGVTGLAGADFQVELCFDASPIGGSPVTVAGAASAFALNGYFNDSSRTIAGFTAGTQITVWVRAWDARTGSSFSTARARAESLRFPLTVPLTGGPPPLPTVMTDLQSFALQRISPPTATALASFRARAAGSGEVRLSWSTLVETQTLGFRVERQTLAGGWQSVTTAMIPARGGDGQPHTYGRLDSSAPARDTRHYRLVAVDTHGRETVLAETAVLPAVVAKVVFGSRTLTIELRGEAGVRMPLETAAELTGPWTGVGIMELDGEGAGSITLDVSTNEPARFYRWGED